jgi:hypothetical protein
MVPAAGHSAFDGGRDRLWWTRNDSRRSIREEPVVAFARVVTFEGVGKDRIEEMRKEMDGDPPEDLPAKEIIVLHDPDAEKSIVVVFFDNEDDYRRGDAALDAMPAGDTPGKRTSVAKYEVPIRMTA